MKGADAGRRFAAQNESSLMLFLVSFIALAVWCSGSVSDEMILAGVFVAWTAHTASRLDQIADRLP